MVKSMFSGVAGLKTHQQKMDVIGNNIANVNTWGFKSSSVNFKDSMYTNEISSAAGTAAGGGVNASQVGYGVTTSSISASFASGAPSPSSRNMDCMIDGTGFFLVGNMVSDSFTNVADSGLSLSRVGIFNVSGGGYLVDDQGNYVYGYALKDGTGIPEKTAERDKVTVQNAEANVTGTDGNHQITIAGIPVDTKSNNLEDQIQDWINSVTKDGGAFAGFSINIDNYQDVTQQDPQATVSLTFTAKNAGTVGEGGTSGLAQGAYDLLSGKVGAEAVLTQVTEGADRVASVPAEYSDELSVIRIPVDPDTGERYQLSDYTIKSDGTVVGINDENHEIVMGQIALISVENPNGLEKTDGYYYSMGENSGEIAAVKAGTGPAGEILGGYLEMANVDLANEFTQMITTQRGYQANSKIITVTDEMLEELVNLKR